MSKVFERPSGINIRDIYSTQDGIDLSDILLSPALRTRTTDNYNVSVKVSHLLLESSTTPGQELGVYGTAAIASGNPNPIEASFSGGFAGHRLVPNRPNDVFGIGYFMV